MNHPRQYQSNLICSRRLGQSVSALEPWGAAWMDMAPLVSLSQQWPCKRCRAMLQIYWLNHVINVINDVVVVVVVVVVVSVAVVVIFVTVLAFWCCGGGVNISAVAMWHHLVTENLRLDMCTRVAWCCGKSSEVLGFPVQLEGAFVKSAGDRVCFFLFFFESLCIFLTYICFNHFLGYISRFNGGLYLPFLMVFFLDCRLCRKRTFRTSLSKRTNPLIVTLQSVPQGDPIFISAFPKISQNMEALQWFMALSSQCLSMKFNELLWMLAVQTADKKLTSTPGLLWELEAIAAADGWSVDTSGCTAVMVLWKDKKARIPRNRAKRTHSGKLGAYDCSFQRWIWDQFCSTPLRHLHIDVSSTWQPERSY